MKLDMEQALRMHVSVEHVKRIINKMVNRASNGDVAAARLILDKLVSNARDSDTGESDSPPPIVVRIENATVFARRGEEGVGNKGDNPPPIDGEYTEAKSE